MDSLNIIPESYELQGNVHNDLPMNITFINDLDSSSVSVQNYVIKHLDDGNLELVFCNNQDPNEERQELQGIIDAPSAHILQQNETVELNLNLNTRVKPNTIESRCVEVPVIRNFQKDSVIQHASAIPQLPKPPQTTTKATTPSKNSSNLIPIMSIPERILLNITIYSCFKCKEQFNSLTLFRQHLKWHKADKNFNCSKCTAGFNAENNLKIHMVTSHPGHHTDVCPICRIKFQRKASLKSHIMMHQVEEFFTCEECHGEFQNDDELLKHMEIHAITRVTKTLSDSLVCPYCKLDFETLAEYKRHVEKHVDVKRNILKGKKMRKKKKEKPGGYKCKYCSKFFSKSCLLDRHERIHTGERPYACTYCNRAFSQKGTLQIHLGSHTGVKPYSCTLCEAKFTQKGNLRAHIEKTHTAPKGNQKIYRCTQCPCIFRKVASLNGHITKVHIHQDAEETESENIIDKVMGSLKLLNSGLGKSVSKGDQLKTQAPPSPPKTTGTSSVRVAESLANGGIRRYLVRQKKIGDVRWYFCNFCSSRFKKPSDLIRHFRTHTLEKPYQCTKCKQAFSLKSTLLNHYKVHFSTACQCSRCDIRIRNPRTLDAHLRSHDTEVRTPNYVCLLCEDVFFTMEEGKRHRSVHDGEIQSTQNIIEPILKQPLYETTYGSLPLKPPKSKIPNTGAESSLERPHQCKGCGARFSRLMSLKRHLLYHSGERKFKCALCPKAFTTKYRLKEHTNYHKNIRNYPCQTCGKKFVTSSLLKRHTIVHNNFKPYLCPYCNKHFKTLLLCRSHIKTVHKLKVYLENGEEGPEDTELMTNGLSDNTDHTMFSHSGKNTKEETFQSKSHRTPAESTAVHTSQSSVMLSVAPHENQQESDPDYQMVYLNIDDLPLNNPDGVLGGNSLKIQNDSLLFNELRDTEALFNIEPNKSYMVDPNEVIQSTTISGYTTSSVISKVSQNTTNVGKLGDIATRRRGELDRCGNGGHGLGKDHADMSSMAGMGDLATGRPEIGLQEFSAMDLGGLPLSIIETEDTDTLSTSMANEELNINPNDMFYDAQVICINCHKVFSDMNVFQKHACSQDPDATATDDLNLLIQNNDGENGHNNEVYSSIQNLPSRTQPSSFKCINMDVQQTENDDIDSVLERDSVSPKDVLFENDKLYFDRLKRFKNKRPLLRDVARLEKSKEFWCKECNYLTTVEERYRKHMSYMHVQSMEKVCKYCYKEFKKLSDLVRHVRTHTGERPYECEKCHKKFSLKSTLESHLRTHNMDAATKICCDVCNSNFTTKSSLKVHMLLHTGARPHTCTFCEQTFRTSAIRKAHERNMHLTKSKQTVTNKPKSGRRLLKSLAEDVANGFGNEKERDDAGLTAESEGVSVIQPTSEAIILDSGQDSVAIDPVILLQNLQSSGIILTPEDGGHVPLNLSDIALLDYESLKGGNDSNINFIGDVENFQYGHIGKTFDPNREEHGGKIGFASSSDNDYEKAEPPPRQPKVVQKVECDICHKMYASKDVLRKHKKNVHGQNKKFPCIKCDKGYDSLEELNKHIVKLHTGYRPYACNYCANSFSEENSLKTHIKRIHQKSLIAQETTNALLGLQFDLPMVPSDSSLL